MCAHCDAIRSAMEELEGRRVMVIASIDKETVLTYGSGKFVEMAMAPNQEAMTFEEMTDIAGRLEIADSPEGRQRLRIALAQMGASTEQIARAESTLDEQGRRPIEERVLEYWRKSVQVPHIVLDDGTDIWGGVTERLMFGPEETFSEFAGDRAVVQVPYFRVEADA